MRDIDESIFALLDDDAFIDWVTDPNETNNEYWHKWMQKNPEKTSDLLNAKQIAKDLAKAQNPSGAKKISKEIWERVIAGIEQAEDVVIASKPQKSRNVIMMAASFAGVLILTSSIYFLLNKNKKSNNNNPSEKIASKIVNRNLLHTNSTLENRAVYLVDGTKVTLAPGTSLNHEIFLQKDKREVYLDGDAFFEVAKDANRPFYVYAHDIVLRVLGTSFNVITDKNNGNITVVVKTGRVSVYKSSNRNKPAFVLTANESVRYTAQGQSIVKSGSDKEVADTDIKPQHPANFNFEETPVKKIFSVLEESYGIKLNYDEKIFSKCIITTSLNDETFEEKLKVICAATNANYRIENDEVFIEGKGCN